MVAGRHRRSPGRTGGATGAAVVDAVGQFRGPVDKWDCAIGWPALTYDTFRTTECGRIRPRKENEMSRQAANITRRPLPLREAAAYLRLLELGLVNELHQGMGWRHG